MKKEKNELCYEKKNHLLDAENNTISTESLFENSIHYYVK